MNITNRRLIALLGLLSAAPVINHANELTGIEPAALKPISAQFETIECAEPCKKPKLSTWWMWRNPTQVELKKVDAQTSELWTWENGSANYQFLMHDEKKVIEYSTVDLKMLNIAVDSNKWEKISNLVLQKDLASMKKTSLKKQYHGLGLSQYNGHIDGINAEIVWIEFLQIPLQIVYFYPKHKTTINLLVVNTNSTTAVATSVQTLNSYERIDYADIGDMEHSALAKKWLSKAQDAPGINSEHH